MSRRDQSRIDPRGRKVKILATIGPASRSPEMLERLVRAGADAFRLNMSHGAHADHEAAIIAIRALEKQYGKPIAILADLQGPKLRVGTFKDGQAVIRHSGHFTLDRNPSPGDETRVCLPHPELFGPGTRPAAPDQRRQDPPARCSRPTKTASCAAPRSAG
jgi:pyruvate kinase